LCDLTGLEKPGHLEGESLLPILKDPSVPGTSVRHEYVRYNGRYHGKALRTEQYRYVRWQNRKGELELEELYDLDADPNESVNVASQLPGVVERLAKQLKNDE
jgi:iduronate 2-sulfatase